MKLLCDHFELEPGKHRAMSDVKALQKVYAKLLDLMEKERVDKLYATDTFVLQDPPKTMTKLAAPKLPPGAAPDAAPKRLGRPPSDMTADAASRVDGGAGMGADGSGAVGAEEERTGLLEGSSAEAGGSLDEGEEDDDDDEEEEEEEQVLFWLSPDPLTAVEARYADAGEDSGAANDSTDSPVVQHGYPLKRASFTDAQVTKLEKEGWTTLQHLLRHYPKSYNQYTAWGTEELVPGTRFVTVARVVSHEGPTSSYGGGATSLKILLEVGATDEQVSAINSQIVFHVEQYSPVCSCSLCHCTSFTLGLLLDVLSRSGWVASVADALTRTRATRTLSRRTQGPPRRRCTR
jgi:hypothetical protein